MAYPSVQFNVLPGNIRNQYGWVKNNPDFKTISLYQENELYAAVAAATKELIDEFKPNINEILAYLENLSGYKWGDSLIDVYPTFLWPSFSNPLSIRVIDFTPQGLSPRPIEVNLGNLIHELGHRLVPIDAFNQRLQLEESMDLLSMRLLDQFGYDFDKYKTISSKASGYTTHTLSQTELFAPNLKAYILNKRR
jgi:hypothetical protein